MELAKLSFPPKRKSRLNYLKKIIKHILVFFFLLFLLGAAYEEILNDKKKQAEYIGKQIESINELLANNKEELDELKIQTDSIAGQISDFNSFLKNYETETYMTPHQIAVETEKVIFLTDEIERIQESFKKKVLNLYKHGKTYDLELLFSSRSPNEYLRRNQYLQHFSQNRRKELRELKSKKFVLEEKKKILSISTSSRRFYIESRRNEKAGLEAKLKELNIDKELIENQANINTEKLRRYETQINNVTNFINNLTENKSKFGGSKINRFNYDSDDLNASKENLNLPVDIGLVVKEFGTSVDGATYTVSFNNGLDFSVAAGSKVYAVGDGIVTLIGELPYYGKCIIIKHGNGFRTVYACLSEVNIESGGNIRLNQIIGKSGETLDGQMLHFELWKDTSPLNPAEWLRK